MALTPEDYQLMEDFIKGRLKGAPLQHFFERLKTDKEFNKKYHHYRENFFAERFNKPNVITTEEVDREEPMEPELPEQEPVSPKPARAGTTLQGGMVWLVIGLALIFVGISLFLILDRIIFKQQAAEISTKRDEVRVKKIREMLADTGDLQAKPNEASPEKEVYKVTVDSLKVRDEELIIGLVYPIAETEDTLQVEYWHDPLNFRGYSYLKGILKLYGVESSVELTLRREGDSLLLEMEGLEYYLKPGSRHQKFRPLQRLPE